eukprot:3089593-Rhodomonas_salina.1
MGRTLTPPSAGSKRESDTVTVALGVGGLGGPGGPGVEGQDGGGKPQAAQRYACAALEGLYLTPASNK